MCNLTTLRLPPPLSQNVKLIPIPPPSSESDAIFEWPLTRTYPEGTADVNASVARQEGGVAVSGGHLSDDDAAEVDEERVETEIVVVVDLATEGAVVVTAERENLTRQPTTHRFFNEII